MRKEMRTDTVRNKEVQQFWKLCKGLGSKSESLATPDFVSEYRKTVLDNGNRRTARAPTLDDIDRRGGNHTRSLRRMLPLAEARNY